MASNETPNGKFRFLSRKRSALKTLCKTALRRAGGTLNPLMGELLKRSVNRAATASGKSKIL